MKTILHLFTLLLILQPGLIFTQNIKEYPVAKDYAIHGTPKILCLVSHKFGANTHFNLDNMRELGWEITLAGLTDTVQPCPWSDDYGNLPLAMDSLLQDIMNINTWDALAIMPANWWSSGGAYVDFLGDQHTLDLISDANIAGKVIWATCAGVRVLAAADVINGKNVTGKQNFQNEYIAAGANYLGPDILPVVDGNIVTSTKGMYFNTEMIEALATAMENLSGRSEKHLTNSAEVNWKAKDIDLPGKDVIWSKIWGAEMSDGFFAVSPTIGGKIVMSGYRYSDDFMSEALNIWIDEDGNLELFNTGGGLNNEFIFDNAPLNDGSVLTAGYTASFGEGCKDIEVTSLNPDGSMNWFATYGGSNIDVAKSIVSLSDGNILVCGHTESLGNGENDVYLLKTWPNGFLIWEQTYGGIKAERGLKAIEASDGNYIVIGETGSFGAGKKDVWLLKVNMDGSEIWSNTFGNQDYQTAHDIIETAGNQFVIVGSSDIHDEDFLNIYIIKTDSNGNLIWEKQMGCPQDFYEHGMSITETPDGNYLITATVNNAVTRCNDAWVLILDPDGELLWSETFGDEGNDRLVDAAVIDDQCIVLAGQTDSWGEGGFDAWAVKISNPLVNIPENKITHPDHSLIVCPAVFSSSVDISFENDVPVEVFIRDISGEKICDFGIYSPGCHRLNWDGRGSSARRLMAGMYFINLVDENGRIQTAKIILHD
jgi:hypothetical protein